MDLIELIEKVNQQDQQAFEKLYQQFYPAGFSLALQFVKNEEDALDLMQDVFITVYSKLDSLEDASKFKSWYMQIVANKCRDFLKKQKPLSFTDANAYDEEGALQFDIEETDRDFIPEEAMDYSETVRIVDEMIAELPEEQRLCILLYFAHDMRIPEIAQALQVSEATVKSRLKYGKDKIRSKAEDYQKKTGTKLYSITGLMLIPFIRWALRQSTVSSPKDSASVFQNIANDIWDTGSQLSTTTATAVQQTTQAAAKAGSLFYHLCNITTTQKVVGGIVAGALLLGSAVGITVTLPDSDEKHTVDPTTSISSSYEETLPQKTQLNWDDYITVEYSGISGQATASVRIDAPSLDAVFGETNLQKFLPNTQAVSAASLFAFSFSEEQGLSNGDTITLTVMPSQILTNAGKCLTDIMAYFDLSFQDTITIKIEGLEELQQIDIFSMIADYITYKGSNGKAYAHFHFPKNYRQTVSDRICLAFRSEEVDVLVDGKSVGIIDLSLIAPNPIVQKEGDLEFIFNENGPLTNGEVLSIELGDYHMSEILEKLSPLGYTIKKLSYEVTVCGL